METQTPPAKVGLCPGWNTIHVDRDTFTAYPVGNCRACPHVAACAHSARVAAGYIDADPPARALTK